MNRILKVREHALKVRNNPKVGKITVTRNRTIYGLLRPNGKISLVLLNKADVIAPYVYLDRITAGSWAVDGNSAIVISRIRLI